MPDLDPIAAARALREHAEQLRAIGLPLAAEQAERLAEEMEG